MYNLSKSRLVVMSAAMILIVMALSSTVSTSDSSLTVFQSPIETPVMPVPTLAPPMSKETQQVLDYIAKREGIAADALLVANQHKREYKLLGRTFWAVTALDVKSDLWYHAMLDLASGRFVDDREAIDRAEQEAHRARYGKLDPALFERLETMKDEETVEVAIWIAGAPQQNEQELYASLAAKYPDAQSALQRSGKPFDVGDHKLINELEAEYVRMLEADTQDRIQSIVRDLEVQGCPVTVFDALPVVATTLPKSDVLKVASREDVGLIYLAGQEVVPELDSAVPDDRAPEVWQKGYDGSQARIAILESGKIDFTGPAGHNYLHQGDVRPCTEAEDLHKTLAASCATSYHGTFRGVAYGAIVDDACTQPFDTDYVQGLIWATNRADPINMSAGIPTGDDMNWFDAAFDYLARTSNDLVVKSSGDTGGSITSPGKGWNVLTVGGTDQPRES